MWTSNLREGIVVIASTKAYGQTYGAHGAYGAKGAEGAKGTKESDGLSDYRIDR